MLLQGLVFSWVTKAGALMLQASSGGGFITAHTGPGSWSAVAFLKAKSVGLGAAIGDHFVANVAKHWLLLMYPMHASVGSLPVHWWCTLWRLTLADNRHRGWGQQQSSRHTPATSHCLCATTTYMPSHFLLFKC